METAEDWTFQISEIKAGKGVFSNRMALINPSLLYVQMPNSDFDIIRRLF